MLTVCFEGVNAIGKDTIITEINKQLLIQNKKVLNTSEPTNLSYNLQIKDSIRRNYSLDEIKYLKLTDRYNVEYPTLDNFTRFYLFMACRSHNVCEIKHNDDLELNDVCLMNRFTLSTLVYNLQETNLPIDKIYETEKLARLGFVPRLNYYLYEESNIILEREMKRELKFLESKYNAKDTNNYYNIYKNLKQNRKKEIQRLLDGYEKAINYLEQKERWNIVKIKNADSLETYNAILDDIFYTI